MGVSCLDLGFGDSLGIKRPRPGILQEGFYGD